MRTARRPAEGYRSALSVGLAVGLAGLAPTAVFAQWSGQATLGVRQYLEEATDPSAPDLEVSMSLQLERVFFWDDGSQFLTVSPFLLLDPTTTSRSRFDFLDLSWEKILKRWEVAVGLRQVDWGVAESASLIGVINQVDFGEDAAAPARLGQPMINVRMFASIGRLEAFALPFFRERRFDGRGATLWSSLSVADDREEFEHSAERNHVDWALRWSQILGAFDVGMAHFAGTNRQPRFEATTESGGEREVLIPFYDQIDQTSVEARWTRSAWLLKLEGFRRASRVEDFVALVGGVEFAFADYLSFFVEYLYDRRGRQATTSTENDVFVGARLLTQDWTISSRVFVDYRSSNLIFGTTASRRIGDTATAELAGRLFGGDSSDEPPLALRLDSHIALKFSYFF